MTDGAYIFQYNSGTSQYVLAKSIINVAYSPLLCDMREDKKYTSIATFGSSTLFLNSSLLEFGTETTPAASTKFSDDGTVWLLMDGSSMYIYTERCLSSYYDQATDNCGACSAGCASCTDASTCTACSSGYTLGSGACT